MGKAGYIMCQWKNTLKLHGTHTKYFLKSSVIVVTN